MANYYSNFYSPMTPAVIHCADKYYKRMVAEISRAVYPASDLETAQWIKENSSLSKVAGYNIEKTPIINHYSLINHNIGAGATTVTVTNNKKQKIDLCGVNSDRNTGELLVIYIKRVIATLKRTQQPFFLIFGF